VVVVVGERKRERELVGIGRAGDIAVFVAMLN
jgi:hypothetical protein